jgi:hypothetical protein
LNRPSLIHRLHTQPETPKHTRKNQICSKSIRTQLAHQTRAPIHPIQDQTAPKSVTNTVDP